MITDEIQIDSLLLRLNMKYVEVIDNRLTDAHRDYQVNENTGEMTPKQYRYKQAEFKPVEVRMTGYKFDFRLKTWTNPSTGKKQEYLYMLVNAKMLENRYFEGVRESNIELIYNALIACKVANFSLHNFLEKGQCTGIEFCKNFTSKNLQSQLATLKKRIQKTPINNPAPKLIKKNGEVSLRFNKKESSSPSKPHLLIYDKEKELVNRSTHFLTTHLKETDITNLARVEFRIKDAEHAILLGIENNNLITFLLLSQAKKQELLAGFTAKYLENRKQVKTVKVTPTKQIYINCMRALKKQGMNFGLIAEIMTEDLPSNRKSEKHKELKDLYYSHIYIPVEIAKSEGEIYDVLNLFLELK